MTTYTNPSTQPRNLRSALRHLWDDQVAAQRALLRLTPYFDEHRQDGR